jgi:hypothetical protein
MDKCELCSNDIMFNLGDGFYMCMECGHIELNIKEEQISHA